MTKDLNRPLLGIFYACLAALMLASMNMFAKMLGDFYGPIDITFYRNIVAIILLLTGMAIFRKLYLIKTKRHLAHFIRSTVGTIGMFFCMWAVIIMPLSIATTFIFTAPLFVTLLSYPLLKEKVSLLRLSSVIIGFIGVYLITNPENNLSPMMIAVGLTAGFFNGVVAICLRWLGSTESSITTNSYFFIYGTILTILLMPFLGGEPPKAEAGWMIAGMGVVGLASLILKTEGFRYGSAALISPFSYTMIIWASIYDYLVWNNELTISVILGSVIIIGSNLFLLWREHRRGQLQKDILKVS
ncbi:MAG: DMT family transporter [Pseudomonadota bacterium]